MAQAGGREGVVETAAERGDFELVVEHRRPGGPREVRGRVAYSHGGRAPAIALSLRLVGRRGSSPLGPGRVDFDEPIGAAPLTVQGAAGETVPFSLPLPATAVAHAGGLLQVGVMLLAEAGTGRNVRMLLTGIDPDPDASLYPLGVPRRTRVARPEIFGLGLAAIVLGLVLAPLGDVAEGYAKLVVALWVGGLITAILSRHGVLSWLRTGVRTIELAAEDGPDGAALLVRLPQGARADGGEVRLVATEYERYRGSRSWGRDIAERRAPLVEAPDGTLRARVPLPPTTEAPQTIRFETQRHELAIRWRVLLRLDRGRGGAARGLATVVPVGIRAPARRDAAPTPEPAGG